MEDDYDAIMKHFEGEDREDIEGQIKQEEQKKRNIYEYCLNIDKIRESMELEFRPIFPVIDDDIGRYPGVDQETLDLELYEINSSNDLQDKKEIDWQLEDYVREQKSECWLNLWKIRNTMKLRIKPLSPWIDEDIKINFDLIVDRWKSKMELFDLENELVVRIQGLVLQTGEEIDARITAQVVLEEKRKEVIERCLDINKKEVNWFPPKFPSIDEDMESWKYTVNKECKKEFQLYFGSSCFILDKFNEEDIFVQI